MILLRCLLAACCLVTLAHADDTEIYGTITTATVEPNVLIIFDTSGSMATADVPGDPYDPAETYVGTYAPATVYVRKTLWFFSWWEEFTSNVSTITCDVVKTKLLTLGYSENSQVKGSSPFSCDSTKDYHLRTGNYRNYVALNDPNSYRRRIDVAKDVLTDLVTNTDGVRFGLMVFNYEQGGRVAAPCGSTKSTILSRHQQRQPGRVDAAGRDPGRGRPLLRRPPELVQLGGHLHLPHAAALSEELHHPHDRRRADQRPGPPALRHGRTSTATSSATRTATTTAEASSTATPTAARTTWTTWPSTCTTRTATPRWATARRSTSRTS